MQNMKIYFIISVIVFLVVVGIYLFLNSRRVNKMNKKFSDFALFTDNRSTSFFDKCYKLLWNFIKKISYVFSKSKLFTIHGKRFDRCILYKDQKYLKGMDYLSLKLILAFITFIITFIFVLIDFINANYLFVVGASMFMYFIPNIFFELHYSRIRKNIGNDILQAIIIINRNLKNNKNIYDSILSASIELNGSIGDEFKKISTDLNHGIGLGDAFKKFDDRIYIDETYFISNLLNKKDISLLDIKDLFMFIEDYLENKKEEENLIKRSFYLSKLLYYSMTILPVLIFVTFYIYKRGIIVNYFNSIIDYILVIPFVLVYFGYILIVNLAFEVDSL